MKNGKDIKPTETQLRDPDWDSFDADGSLDLNILSLPAQFKERLKAQGLDWRFLNASKFRENGGMHRGLWKPYKVTAEDNMIGVNAEGFLQRQDLILGVRPKKITLAMRERKAARTAAQAGFNKNQAQELRKMARDHGVEKDTKVYDGYDEND
jgi:hypothetical protein